MKAFLSEASWRFLSPQSAHLYTSASTFVYCQRNASYVMTILFCDARRLSQRTQSAALKPLIDRQIKSAWRQCCVTPQSNAYFEGEIILIHAFITRYETYGMSEKRWQRYCMVSPPGPNVVRVGSVSAEGSRCSHGGTLRCSFCNSSQRLGFAKAG